MTTPTPVHNTSKGILIALVGSDGSGKSTLTGQLVEDLKTYGTACRIYLGQGSGDLGRRIGKWPLIGPRLHKFLLKKAAANHAENQKIPGVCSALVALGFSIMRYWKFKKIDWLIRHYDFVLTDRYPQAEFKGQFDGPSLVPTPADNFLMKKLSEFESSLYTKMAQRNPDLIFRLLITPELAYSRKPDHNLELLIRKCAISSKLHYNHSKIREIDASDKLENIKAKILKEILEARDQAHQS